MANEFIPEPLSGAAGAGPSPGGAPRTVDYRQLQAPTEMLEPWRIPETGKRQEAEALVDAFRGFRQAGQDLFGKAATATGTQTGAAAGATGKPDLKAGLQRFTAYGEAYNNAAIGSFLTESEAHAEDTAAKLRVQSNMDPAIFAKTFGAAADGAVGAAPPQAQGALRQMYNQHLAAGVASLSQAQAEDIREQHKNTYDMGTERAISRVAQLQGSDNPDDQRLAIDEHAKLELRIQGGVNAGLYTPAEAQAKSVNAMKEITAQVFSTQLDKSLAGMAAGHGDADVIKLLDNFRAAHVANLADTSQPPVFSEAEFSQLYQLGKQKLMQENLTEANARRDGKSAEDLKYEAGDRAVTVALAQNMPAAQLSAMVSKMVANQDLKPEIGRSVLGSIERGRDAPPNARGLFNAENDPDRFDWTSGDISAKIDRGEINSKQAIDLTTKIEQQRNGWESHPPIRDAQKAITAALKLPTGIALQTASDDEKKAATDAQVEFTKQMGAIPVDKRDAEAPRIAQNVIRTIQAQDSDSKAAAFEQQRKYVDQTYGPGGTSYRSAADYAARKQHIDDMVKAARTESARLRSEVKQ